jgi:ribonuclease BN (tRNA processing enzyme)
MKLTILGNNGPFPAAGGACSGYLIEEDGIKLLIDCGNGVLGNLQKFIPVEGLDGVILTHLHSDHMSDMLVMRYAVQIKRNRGTMDKAVNVFAPPEPLDEYNRLNVKDAFNINPITGDLILKFGKLQITFEEMKHPVKCFAVSVENGDRRFVFSGDTSWNENIIEFSRGADVLMLDAGLMSRDKTADDAPHLTAYECGIIAQKAGAGMLLLTHFWPEYDIGELVSEARQNFERTEASRLLQSYRI